MAEQAEAPTPAVAATATDATADVEIATSETMAAVVSSTRTVVTGISAMTVTSSAQVGAASVPPTGTDDADASPRRETLSPSKASLFAADAGGLDEALTRRDTVSPASLKAVLQLSAGASNKPSGDIDTEELDATLSRGETASPRTLKAVLEASAAAESEGVGSPVRSRTRSNGKSRKSLGGALFEQPAPDNEREKSSDKELLDASPARSTRSRRKSREKGSAEKELQSKPSPGSGRRTRHTSSASAKESVPDSLSSILEESEAARRTTLDPADVAAVIAQMELEAKGMNAETRTGSEASASGRRQSIQPHHPGKQKQKQKKASPKRRTTLEPSDVLLLHGEDGSEEQEDGRRQTIDDNELLELQGALDSSVVGNEAETGATRKRRRESHAQTAAGEKRSRVTPLDDGKTEEDEPMRSTDSADPSRGRGDNKGSKRKKTTGVFTPAVDSPSVPKNLERRHASDKEPAVLVSPDTNKEVAPTDPSLTSPPAGGTRVRTPLKGILSARKRKQGAGGEKQTTPNKSVNFGPSQGAEFNHGSPSTSMTPMAAKVALRMFPLDRPDSPDEDADEETSLNSSILSEADSIDSDEAKQESEDPKQSKDKQQTKQAGTSFDPLQRRTSLHVPQSVERRRRRYSLRGYSPLDNQAEARRRRRKSVNVARQTSSATNKTPSSTARNSFLSTTDAMNMSVNRSAYADSSASSDAGEDMDITGDYSNHATAAVQEVGSAEANKKRTSLSAAQSVPFLDGDTAEFSLRNLLAESEAYEPLALSSLLAERPEPTVETSRRLDETTLDPILEEDEGASSSHHSMMSLDSSVGDSDADDTGNRKSLAVNLSSSFDQVGETSGVAPNSHSKPSPRPAAPSVRLVTMEELLESVDLGDESLMAETEEQFFGSNTESSGASESTLKDVKYACAHDACLDEVERNAQEIASYSSGLTDELAALLRVKASALFSPENLSDAGRKAIQELFAVEATVARSGWCQLRSEMETQVTANLRTGVNALENDVKSLKASISNDTLKRQNELAAIQELIEREQQMGLLLDAIEEQQDVRNEYAKAVESLETQCSALSLEESVLQSRLNVLEGRAAELEPVTSAASTLFEQQVLGTEEMLTIQESLSVWRILEATSSRLRLNSRFEDVFFDVDIGVQARFHASSRTGGAESPPLTSIKVNESLKQGKRNTYLAMEDDAVLLFQRLLLDPLRLSEILEAAKESHQTQVNDHGQLCATLQHLERYLSQSFRLLRELRQLSTHFAVHFDTDSSMLWVGFLKFPSAESASPEGADSAQFGIGFSITPTFPFTDYRTETQVKYAQVSSAAVEKEIKQVSREAPEYFTRVCRRVHESFVKR